MNNEIDNQKIRELYESGLTLADLQRLVKRGAKHVRKCLLDAGVTIRSQGRQEGKVYAKRTRPNKYVLSPDRQRKRNNWQPKLKDLYESGMTLREIRQKTGLSVKYIAAFLKESGVIMRKPGFMDGRQHKKPSRPTKLIPREGWESESPNAECNQRLKNLYESGATLAELMKLTGMSQRQVTKRLLSTGATLRQAGHMTGKSMPEEVIRKGIEKRRGQKRPPITEATREKYRAAGRKRGAFTTGKRHSDEARRKMSESRKGAGNARWIDGRKQTPYPPEWTKALRKEIRELQDHRCAICGQKNHRDMHVHHIDWNKVNCVRSNLVGLCYICHGLVHRSATAEEYKNQLSTFVEQRDSQ